MLTAARGTMGSDEDRNEHGPIDEAAVRDAEAEFLIARERWRREHGGAPPPEQEPPDDVQRAEQAFIAARELWHRDREAEAGKRRGESQDA